MGKQEEGEKEGKAKKETRDPKKMSIHDLKSPSWFKNDDPPPSNRMIRPLVTRKDWRADPPKAVVPLKFPVKHVLFTYTNTEECATTEQCRLIIQRLQRLHMHERGLSDIQYNFLVGSDLNVYEGRGWAAKPDKNEKYPKLSETDVIEYAYIGNFKDKSPPMKVMQAAWWLLEDSLDQGKMWHKFEVTEDYHDSADLGNLEQYINQMPTDEPVEVF